MTKTSEIFLNELNIWQLHIKTYWGLLKNFREYYKMVNPKGTHLEKIKKGCLKKRHIIIVFILAPKNIPKVSPILRDI